MQHWSHRSAFAGLTIALAAGFAAASAQTPPEGPGGGDVALGAEAPGVDAVEWEALTRGSETAAAGNGGLQALLESANVDLVAFYQNLNQSLAVDEDDAYHVYARRCGSRSVLTEDCDPAEIVFDHLVFARTATSDGGFAFEVLALTAEYPVGTVLALPPVNPFGEPLAPGPVSSADREDPRRDPTALARLSDELLAGTQSVTESEPPTEAGVFRSFIPPEHTTYPYPYERIAAVFDDSDAPDLLFVPTPSGDLAASPPRGGHGSLDVTQSRATFLVSGRGARRTPLAATDESALAIRHVDVAPTVAKVLGIPPHAAARYLNGGDDDANPAAPDALLLRQDGKPLDALLEPRVNVFVVVIDGMVPENVTATDTPNLCNLTGCPGAAAPDESAHTTVYGAARAVMVSQTNANHAAMMTGAYGATNGIVANNAYDRSANQPIELDRPELIRIDTLFDTLRREAPHLSTAAVLGKAKLRSLFDCTNTGGVCTANLATNPESVPVTHVRPDFLRGALELPAEPGPGDCPAEPGSGSGVALDDCIMDQVIELSATEDPDFVFVNLGNVDAIQHVSGPNSPAADAAVLAADTEIGRLVQYLKESGKWRQSVVIVTADHSFSWQNVPPSGRIDLEARFAPCVSQTGETFSFVTSGGTAHVYLDSIEVGTAPPLSAPQYEALSCMRARATGPSAPAGISEAWYRFENPLDPGKTLTANRAGWNLADQRAGDLVVTALASGPTAGLLAPTAPGTGPFEVASGPGFTLASAASSTGAIPGDHGHPGARHVPFIVASGGDFVNDQLVPASGGVNEGDDTAANPEQPEAVDIAPTVAWMLGLDPAVVMPAAQGRVLDSAFGERPIDAVEPHANRAIVLIFDGNNSVRIHDLSADCDEASCATPENLPVAAIRSLMLRDTDARSDVPVGTLASFGSISGYPSVTFPNHNVVGSGAYPGHHGIVDNRYYERDIETERNPIDMQDPRNPLYFFTSGLLRSDFETLHEAVHRAFGDWSPSNPAGAFTASVNEPSARGADFASLETVSSENLPAVFAALSANATEFVEDTDSECAQQSPSGYGAEAVIDHIGQAQARALYSEPTTSSFARPSGVNPLVIDDSTGAAHPDPKYLIENFTITDGAGHEFGPHGNCARRAYRDTSSRLGRVLDELRNHGRFDTEGEPARLGETFILVTGDHGMENQDLAPGRHDQFDATLTASDVEYVRQETFLYLLTMDVAIAGVPEGGLVGGQPASLTFTVTDADARADASATPIANATVTATSDAGSASGLTDANGQVVLAFTPAGAVRIVVDKDANGAAGGPTLGSTSPDPVSHGLVTKQDFNDRVITLPEPGGALGLALATTLLSALRRRRSR
jgi:predicted AlkP superfamily pyrophosphatase or phosphodiesterase